MKIKGAHPLNLPPCKAVAGRKEWQRIPSTSVAASSRRKRQGVHNPLHSQYFTCITRPLGNSTIQVTKKWWLPRLPVVNCLQLLPCVSSAMCQMLIASSTWAIGKIGQLKIIGALTERKSSTCPKIQKKDHLGWKIEKKRYTNSMILFLSPVLVHA